MSTPATPVCDRYAASRPQRDAVTGFLLWLAESTPYRIGRSVPLEPYDAADDEDEADLRTTHTGRLVLAIGHLVRRVHDIEHFTEVDPEGRVLHALLCRWLDIDPAALERERRALLAAQRGADSVRPDA